MAAVAFVLFALLVFVAWVANELWAELQHTRADIDQLRASLHAARHAPVVDLDAHRRTRSGGAS